MLYKKLVLITAVLTFIVVVVGAYVRLSDAGLGCPDWPGCYGHITVPSSDAARATAMESYPNVPIKSASAWKEMVHRYLAGTLGLLLLAVALTAWRKRHALNQSPALPLLLIILVAFQATLGMWTVTLLLKPAIVTAHLLGGMAILALIVWHSLRQFVSQHNFVHGRDRHLRRWAIIGLVIVIIQVTLGGWVSSNYAALACSDFPLCHGLWLPGDMDFLHAFHIHRELGMTAEGGLLSTKALTAIHWTHRLGALLTFIYLAILAFNVLRVRALKSNGVALFCALLLQVGLGIATVWLSLPLPLAVAHNAGAALLLVTMVVLNFRLRNA